jgi:SanA protein
LVFIFFQRRLDAAAELYHSGKVKKLILSGDNGRKDYYEPEAMRQELIVRGVPDQDIYCDYAGFSTLDSVVRAKTIFGAEKFLVISQRFHSERAIFLARANGIEAYGFAAEDIDLPYWKYKNRFRESLARAAALLDVITFRSPRFGGEMVDMNLPQERAL